jgi:hypothetical protein
MSLQPLIDRNDVLSIIKNAQLQLNQINNSLNGNIELLGQKVISEILSKLSEMYSASHFSNKLGISVTMGGCDKEPDNCFNLPTGKEFLEWKVALTVKGDKKVIFRGGNLSTRQSDAIFVARNRDFTDFFVAIIYMMPNMWIPFTTQYSGPKINEEILYTNKAVPLIGSFDTIKKGNHAGKPIIKLEKI